MGSDDLLQWAVGLQQRRQQRIFAIRVEGRSRNTVCPVKSSTSPGMQQAVYCTYATAKNKRPVLPIRQYSFCKNSSIPRCLFHFLNFLTSVYDNDSFLVFFSFFYFYLVQFGVGICWTEANGERDSLSTSTAAVIQ